MIETTQISERGKQIKVPSLTVGDNSIVVTGKFLKVARFRSEDYVQGNWLGDLNQLVEQVKASTLGADVFSFAQRIPDTVAQFNFPVYLDNLAAIQLTDYKGWWEGQLSQDTRRNIRLAAKRGAILKAVPFDENLVRGITAIYNETPLRQGRKFWHFGKTDETVRRENASFIDRSEFIGAYCGDELIGFIKMVYVDRNASIMQILSKVAHQDKKPTNALIAKAVEICCEKGVSHLIYCKYVYHKNHHDALTEFKRRNAFQKVEVPRYYIPLTLKGKVAVGARLQLGLLEMLPEKVVVRLLKLRSRYYESRFPIPKSPASSIVSK